MNTIERLHYFDGMRLDAAELRVEQRYHMYLRRLINRSFFSPGAVNGLEVEIADPHRVTVYPGLAIDPRGRELVVMDAQSLAVPNRPPVNASLGGYYLTIRYGEERVPGAFDGCRRGSGPDQPSRIREVPVIGWSEDWPNHALCGKGHPADCQVVLALVQLDASCAIGGLNTDVRQSSEAVVPGPTPAYALEGERDVTASTPAAVHFHVRSGRPQEVVLYLYGLPFTTHYYTELGGHQHGLSAAVAATVPMPAHVHEAGQLLAKAPGAHSHQVSVLDNVLDDLGQPDQISNVPLSNVSNATYRTGTPPYIGNGGDHTHSLSGETGFPGAAPAGTHSHPLLNPTDRAGTSDVDAREGAPGYGYLSDLHVWLDGTDITNLIVGRLGWAKLGDGTATSPLAHGTGAVDLVGLGLNVGHGEHKLEFKVAAGGGKVAYNLYVQ